jgi:hypothetical protein
MIYNYRKSNLIWVLIAINIVLFIATTISPQIMVQLGLIPLFLKVHPWTIVTSMFIHANFMHLLFNMLTLYFFGTFLLMLVDAKKVPAGLFHRWDTRQFFLLLASLTSVSSDGGFGSHLYPGMNPGGHEAQCQSLVLLFPHAPLAGYRRGFPNHSLPRQWDCLAGSFGWTGCRAYCGLFLPTARN